MPDDYQAILDDLGVDTSSTSTTEETTSTPDQTTDATPTADNTTPAESTGATESTEAQTSEASDNDRIRNDAFAAMRTENAKYKKFIGQIMKGANFDGKEEDFMNTLIDASYKQQASRQGNQVSPELIKRMDSLEDQNRTLIESQNRQTFAANLKNMQSTLALTDGDIKEFIDLAVKEQIDLTIPGTNFVTLYQGLFFDKLNKRNIETERQKWIAQNSKADNAANPDGKSGKKDPTPTNVNTMAEFNSLLQSMPKK